MSNLNLNENKQETSETGIYKGLNEVSTIARQVIDEMKDGDRMSREDFNEKVFAKTSNLTKSNVINLVGMCLKSSKEVTVELGRMGGIYKGGRMKRIDARARCETCNQVVRAKPVKKIQTKSEENTEVDSIELE